MRFVAINAAFPRVGYDNIIKLLAWLGARFEGGKRDVFVFKICHIEGIIVNNRKINHFLNIITSCFIFDVMINSFGFIKLFISS